MRNNRREHGLWKGGPNVQVISNPEGIKGAGIIKNIVSIKQADYDALINKDNQVLYFIID